MPERPQRRCSCSIRSPELYPFHVMFEHLNALLDNPERPQFPSIREGHSCTQERIWADAFEAIARQLGLSTAHSNRRSGLHRAYCPCRGANSWRFTIELWRIQLFGQWDSDVFVHLYSTCKTLPRRNFDMLALESTAAMSVQRAQTQLHLLQNPARQNSCHLYQGHFRRLRSVTRPQSIWL